MMNRITLILSSLLISAFAHAATDITGSEVPSLQCDTLASVSFAKELNIETDKTCVWITVKGLDGTKDNFYYKVEASGKRNISESISSKFKEIQDLKVVEIGGRKVRLTFLNADKDQNVLTYDIPDPDNRETTCYTSNQHLDFGITLGKKGKIGESQWRLVSAGLGIGFVTPVNALPNLDTSMGRSIEFSWLMVIGAMWRHGRNSLSFGLGLDSRNYRLKQGSYLRKQADGSISLQPFENGEHNTSSSLSTFGLQIPMLYTLKLGHQRNFGLTLGPILNFNVEGSIVTRYKIDSEKHVITTGHIGQRPVTLDLFGAIHYNSIGLYARYAPMKVLKSKTGLDFQSFSTGIMIMF